MESGISNNQNLLFSIITIVYNGEKTIRRTIESVLNQECLSFEYIIVDGNSTDKTLEIICDFPEKFRQKGISFKYISEKDQGIADAFNKGINIAKGEYVGIINADDWYEKNTLDIVRNNIDKEYSVYCGDLNLYQDNILVKKRKSKPAMINYGMYILHPTTFVARSIYVNCKFDTNYKIAMDYDLMMRVMKNKNKVKYIPKVLANMESGGVSSNLTLMNLEERSVIIKYLSKFQLKKYDIFKFIAKIIYK